MTSTIRALAYIVASLLFILSLRGLSTQETARRGNRYGLLGMVVAVLCTALALVLPDGVAMPTAAARASRAWASSLARSASAPSSAGCSRRASP